MVPAILFPSARYRAQRHARQLVAAAVDSKLAERVLDVAPNRGAVVIPQTLERQPDRAGGVADQADVVVGVGNREPPADLLDLYLRESRFAQEAIHPLRPCHAER